MLETAPAIARTAFSGLDGARSWLSVNFDVDAEALWISVARGRSRPALLSQGLYGLNEGVPRILALLSDLGIRATFFVPGMVAEAHPSLVPELAAAEHEIASHAYTHMPLSAFESAAQEADELRRAKNILEAQAGREVVGFGAPVCDVSPNTLGILIEQGFTYDRSFLDADRPYLFRSDGGSLVELPVSWVLDDFSFFGHNIYPKLGWGIQDPAAVAPVWSGELASFRDDGGFGCLVLHPEVIGRRPRLRMLREVLSAFAATERFWTCAEVAADLMAETADARHRA
jgi:peptidoglycan/xylan/chitin deacetylase (PgdA/CDA1 family)